MLITYIAWSYTGKLVQERRTEDTVPLEHHAAADADRLETILACTCMDRSLSTIKALKPFAKRSSVELLGISGHDDRAEAWRGSFIVLH